MGDHYVKKCRVCDAVLGQCRCPGPKKTLWEICEACQAKAAQKADYFTDMGHDVRCTEGDTGEKFFIGRYGAWKDGECIDTAFDLDKLKEKYGDKPVRLIKIKE